MTNIYKVDKSMELLKNTEGETKINEMSKENFVSPDGKVYILGPFDRSISANVIPALNALIEAKTEEKNPVIEVYINSHGGYTSELWGLLTLLNIAKHRGIGIVTFNIGSAYSCGSMLAVYGDHRVMSKYADNLMHLGSGGGIVETFKQLDRHTEHMNKHFKKIIDLYAEHTKIPKKKLEKMLEDDNMFLDAEQCLKMGLCDEII